MKTVNLLFWSFMSFCLGSIATSLFFILICHAPLVEDDEGDLLPHCIYFPPTHYQGEQSDAFTTREEEYRA